MLRGDERIGLAAAILAHVALVAALVWQPPGTTELAPPERMTVTLAEDVAMTSTSPRPAAEAPPDEAPQLGEAPPVPEPIVRPEPEPAPRPIARPVPAPRPQTKAAPVPRPQPKAQPPRPKAQPAPRPSQSARPAGASRIDNDFLKGMPGAQSTRAAQSAPAATFGPSERASLQSAINRQLRPAWKSPQGIDVEKLDTTLTWDLNPDGSLKGSPRLVRQEGKTPSNAAQAQRHIEQAIRAVQIAAPFDLPPQFYDQWKRLTWHFDRNLSR